MTRPGWAPDCTCGKTPQGYFCQDCKAWAGSSYGEQASWSRPRSIEPRPEKLPIGGSDGADEEPQGSGAEIPAEVIMAAIPDGVRCKNGRYARAAKSGEKVLPCGCPLTAAPRECVDEVATLRVTPRRPPIEH